MSKPTVKPKKIIKIKPKKRLAKPAVKKEPLFFGIKNIKGKLVGRVSHYFSNINVVAIKLSAPLSWKDQIRIVGGDVTDFNQKVGTMQVNHKEIKKAKKGDNIGLKTKEKAREGYRVYKV